MVKKLAYASLIAFGGLILFPLIWWLFAAMMPWEQAGHSIWRTYRLGFSPAPRSGQILILLWIALCFGVAAGLSYRSDDTEKETVRLGGLACIPLVFAILLMVPGTGNWWVFGTDTKLEASPYVQSVQIEYANQNTPPRVLNRLLGGNHDVGPARTVAGKPTNFLSKGFQERPASLAGAERIITERYDSLPGTNILPETLAYIPGSESEGSWTAILDGKSKSRRNPIDGIAEWDGNAQDIKQCRFTDDNRLNGAITGKEGNSLSDKIRSNIPDNVNMTLSDMYGYCEDGDTPVIVMPVTLDRWNGSVSYRVPAGVVTVRGSANGNPVVKYQRSVKADEIPGPVYPMSIAQKQREMINWSAGRKWSSSDGFGFEPVNIDANAENPSDYNLRSLHDGQMYYATPLTSKGGKSQVIQAVSMVSSDSVTYGKLNTMHVQVRDDQEGPGFTEQDLQRRAKEVMRKLDSSFLNKGQGGRMEEFLPGANGEWLVFATQDGLPRYLLRIRPGQLDQAVELNGGKLGKVLVSGNDPSKGADEDLSDLTDEELQAKMDAVIDEMSNLRKEQLSREKTTTGG